MRADRLLALLMLLQTRGRMTAQGLAEELEVTERTIYRDMQALSTAGVPVYAERGPGGGCSLIEEYRTRLTGLNQDEVRALFTLSIPAPLAELGLDRELKAALLKLSAALPGSRRLDESGVRQRVHIDWKLWSQAEASSPHLQTIHQAVWDDRCVYLTRRLLFDTHVEHLVEPYGLVAKLGMWYLVAKRQGRLRVYDLRQVLAVHPSETIFERPENFDLSTFWDDWRQKLEGNRLQYPVVVRVAPDLAPFLPLGFDDHQRGAVETSIAQAGPPDEHGWLTFPLTFERFEEARARLLTFGGALEVLEPLALRLSLADFARQAAAVYEN